jgi:hypothetical protein
MTPTQKTIGFLRTLTADGLLSSEEIWSLGKFLNENETSVEVWPGNLLLPMLGSAFEDGHLNEEEMDVLASTISSIEQEWATKNPHLHPPGPPGPLPVNPPQMPRLELTMEMPSSREEKAFVINLMQHTCTCPDSHQRKVWPVAHPGRCCKHMANAFSRTGKPMEPWFQTLLDDCFMRGRGTDPVDDWLLAQVPKVKPALISGGPSEWCSVFVAENKGYERFAFNRVTSRWSYGAAPTLARAIESTIHEHF